MPSANKGLQKQLQFLQILHPVREQYINKYKEREKGGKGSWKRNIKLGKVLSMTMNYVEAFGSLFAP